MEKDQETIAGSLEILGRTARIAPLSELLSPYEKCGAKCPQCGASCVAVKGHKDQHRHSLPMWQLHKWD